MSFPSYLGIVYKKKIVQGKKLTTIILIYLSAIALSSLTDNMDKKRKHLREKRRENISWSATIKDHIHPCTKTKSWKEHDTTKWVSSWDYCTYHIGDQRRLRRACASAQSRQSLRCSHTWSMEIKKINNYQELIQSDPTACPQNQKGNN